MVNSTAGLGRGGSSMKDSEVRVRTLVDRMLREAGAAERYASRGKASFFDLRTPEIRDAVELRILHLTETATKLGRPFRNANPLIPWDDLDRLRNDLVPRPPAECGTRICRAVHSIEPTYGIPE